MKIEMFHLCPYRDLPEDFREKNRSVWVDVPSHLFDAQIASRTYNQTLDELKYAAEVGYDGICVNEHHQNAYGLMPSPNIMAAAMSRETEDVAIIVMGNSIALYDPPIRVAEEMAMLDCISGGRLVAGFPVGSAMDTAYGYGANPALLRDKYAEAEELILRAWEEKDIFSFDGKYTQLRYVNIWPRPMQEPRPPVWVPGAGSIETWNTCIEKGHLYAYLSYSGFKRGKQVMDGFWKVANAAGVDNPYHAGFLQLVCIADSEQELHDKYAAHTEYFFNKMLHVYPGFSDPPGYRTVDTIKAGLLAQTTTFGRASDGEVTFDQLREAGNVVAGTPEQVTEQLRSVAKDLHIGHLMILNQFGSIPHELAKENIRRTAQEVVPNLRDMWSEYEDHWWPQNAIVREGSAAPASAD
ncbi:MAG: LLM class flavin-dependent oxidoreductase [Dehalococcoidia bacterium]|jgi:alkanesulfonate monooxygenase SsuD/methylene tetrahydromethanopterin reductase-like flavin-dependent oxidoreductase (luciferase family)|nr:LLM class flavin-dependent oxidoreductase [Dehalococcoidia bacterium]